MIPFVWNHSTTTESFPRVSGDEPVVRVLVALVLLFSPRERG